MIGYFPATNLCVHIDFYTPKKWVSPIAPRRQRMMPKTMANLKPETHSPRPIILGIYSSNFRGCNPAKAIQGPHHQLFWCSYNPYISRVITNPSQWYPFIFGHLLGIIYVFFSPERKPIYNAIYNGLYISPRFITRNSIVVFGAQHWLGAFSTEAPNSPCKHNNPRPPRTTLRVKPVRWTTFFFFYVVLFFLHAWLGGK